MTSKELLIAVKKVLDKAELDKFSGEVEIRIVYGQGGVRDCFYSVKQKLT